MPHSTFNSAVIAEVIQKVRDENPLVHNITNYVVMNWTANCLLALGASPVMAHSLDEVEDMVSLSKSLVINIGTLSPLWVDAMESAMKVAHSRKIPIILDPVGVGATPFRSSTLIRLLAAAPPTVIRGNASEIIAMMGDSLKTKGVDTQDSSKDAITAAEQLSRENGCVVCVSGEVDYVIGDGQTWAIANGHPLMTRVTGMGCAATALIGACVAVHSSSIEATISAMSTTGIAGEMAANESLGPGSFQGKYMDHLYRVDPETIIKNSRVHLV